MRARLGLGLPLDRGEAEALRAIARDLNRIGGNINQIARAANAAVQAGKPVSVDPAVLDEAQAAVQEAKTVMREALARSAGSWQVPV